MDHPEENIRRVLIAPYNRILRWQFLAEVFAGADPDRALSICRDGKYEVVILSEYFSPDREEHRPKTLCEYLLESGAAETPRTYATGAQRSGTAPARLSIGDRQAGATSIAS